MIPPVISGEQEEGRARPMDTPQPLAVAGQEDELHHGDEADGHQHVERQHRPVPDGGLVHHEVQPRLLGGRGEGNGVAPAQDAADCARGSC